VSRDQRPRILLVEQMPPTKGGITTFMLNLMGSYRRQFYFHSARFSATRRMKILRLRLVTWWGSKS
jgi:hypothetical protein